MTFVEKDRDRWQRAPEIISALNLQSGSRVADIGCGAGYFALKLSAAVGKTGNVQAVDIRRTPLVFLWLRSPHNLSVVLSTPEDPKTSGALDAILIANTYHEFADPKPIMERLHRALRQTGSLVVADRGSPGATADHALDPALAASQLRQYGFEVVRREDHFLDQPGEGPWWLIVARPIVASLAKPIVGSKVAL